MRLGERGKLMLGMVVFVRPGYKKSQEIILDGNRYFGPLFGIDQILGYTLLYESEQSHCATHVLVDVFRLVHIITFDMNRLAELMRTKAPVLHSALTIVKRHQATNKAVRRGRGLLRLNEVLPSMSLAKTWSSMLVLHRLATAFQDTLPRGFLQVIVAKVHKTYLLRLLQPRFLHICHQHPKEIQRALADGRRRQFGRRRMRADRASRLFRAP